MRTFWMIVALLAVLFGTFAVPAGAFAQTPQALGVACPANGGVCQAFSVGYIQQAQHDAYPDSLKLMFGGYTSSTSSYFVRVPNPYGWPTMGNISGVPSEVHLKIGVNTSVPDMGVYLWGNVLMAYKPGWLKAGEVPTGLPSNRKDGGLESVPYISGPISDWDKVTEGAFFHSVSFDGTHIINWTWAPVLQKDEIVLYVTDISFTFLSETASMPAQKTYFYDTTAGGNWKTGELLKVISVNKEYNRIQSDLFVDTDWRAAFEYTDSYVVYRYGLSKGAFVPTSNPDYPDANRMYTLKAHDIFAEAPCTLEEQCYSKGGFGLGVGQTLFVDGSTMWSMALNDSTLWLTTINPAKLIMPEDSQRLAVRWQMGQLDKVEGVVSGVYFGENNSYQIQLGGNEHLNLAVSFAPAVGTHVIAYVYKPSVDIGPAWRVMALFDSGTGYLWFFNTEVEYCQGYDPLWYGTMINRTWSCLAV